MIARTRPLSFARSRRIRPRRRAGPRPAASSAVGAFAPSSSLLSAKADVHNIIATGRSAHPLASSLQRSVSRRVRVVCPASRVPRIMDALSSQPLPKAGSSSSRQGRTCERAGGRHLGCPLRRWCHESGEVLATRQEWALLHAVEAQLAGVTNHTLECPQPVQQHLCCRRHGTVMVGGQARGGVSRT